LRKELLDGTYQTFCAQLQYLLHGLFLIGYPEDLAACSQEQ